MINWEEKIKEALKAKQSLELKTYRNIKTEILNLKKSPGFKSYTDQDELNLLKRIVKVLKKSENEYFQAGREDLVSDCVAERKIIESFLPASIPIEILKTHLFSLDFVLSDPITGNCTVLKKNMGKAISALKTQFPSVAGEEIANLVKSYVI